MVEKVLVNHVHILVVGRLYWRKLDKLQYAFDRIISGVEVDKQSVRSNHKDIGPEEFQPLFL